MTTGACHDTIEYIQNKYHFVIKEAIADRGYGAAENIQYLQGQNIITYIPLFSTNSGKIVKLEEYGFIFDQQHNRYICPQGKVLLPKARDLDTVKSKTIDCQNCPISNDCPASLRKCSQHIRHIYRSHNQLFFEVEQQRMQTPLFLKKLKERMWKIEGLFAEAKNRHGLLRAKYRGIQKTNTGSYDCCCTKLEEVNCRRD